MLICSLLMIVWIGFPNKVLKRKKKSLEDSWLWWESKKAVQRALNSYPLFSPPSDKNPCSKGNNWNQDSTFSKNMASWKLCLWRHTGKNSVARLNMKILNLLTIPFFSPPLLSFSLSTFCRQYFFTCTSSCIILQPNSCRSLERDKR